mmetsp:Transcript_10020/g.22435  ORF Transcript_10020/g.22435 Transcript_10020/m.22435 type:complete len:106 (-) Transcript_10020:361-678(-)
MGLWRNAMTANSVSRLLSYRPMDLIDRRKNAKDQPPVLLVGAENDTACLVMYVKTAVHQIHGSELFILQGAGHFDVYGGDNLKKTLEEEVLFLKTHIFADQASQL